MKVLSTEGLTKLIQLIKSTFIPASDTVSASTVTLADVATTGDYDDLINQPTIPTVNNATLTIQKNGTSVATFTANSSTNTTANITVPTTAADVSALPASTKYGADLSYSSDTLQLLDQDGNALGNSVTIQASASIDNMSITKNGDDEIQTVGVIDQNNPSTPLKQWSGTKAQYDAIATKDSNTLYNITDDAVASDFANTDLSNLTTTGKSYVAGIGMPSDTYENIGTSPYVAPANGWVSTDGVCTGNVWAFIVTTVCESTSTSDSDKVKYRDICWCGIANNGMFAMTPVKKGDKVWFGSSNFSTNSLRFIYSEGEV